MPADKPGTADWRVCRDGRELVERAATAIADWAARQIDINGAFRIALAGGTTPRHLYQRLARLDTNWHAWHIYFGDERCVPVGDTQRNDAMAHSAWLNHVPIPTAQLHPIPAERGAREGALAYAAELAEIDGLDMALLGIGEDGHTASLFPGAELGLAPDAPLALPVLDAPKPPPERVSMSLHALNRARQILVLIDGETKRQAVAAWRAGADLPVAGLAAREKLVVFVTRAALPAS